MSVIRNDNPWRKSVRAYFCIPNDFELPDWVRKLGLNDPNLTVIKDMASWKVRQEQRQEARRRLFQVVPDTH